MMALMNEESKILESVSDVVASFGGTSKFATLIGVKPNVTSNWKKSGQFPEHMHMRIFLAIREHGLLVKGELVGIPTEIAA